MLFHFSWTKKTQVIVDAELQWGGQVCQGFDVFKLPLVLGGIDLVLGLVVVLPLVSFANSDSMVILNPHDHSGSCPYILFKGILENSDMSVDDHGLVPSLLEVQRSVLAALPRCVRLVGKTVALGWES